jgi:hypothetical protein
MKKGVTYCDSFFVIVEAFLPYKENVNWCLKIYALTLKKCIDSEIMILYYVNK